MHPELHFESWSISTYYLIISLDFCLMFFYLRHRAQQQKLRVGPALDLGIWASIFGLMGARLFHVFYEESAYYAANPLNVFKVWEGGYVFLGGLITAIISSWFWLKWRGGPGQPSFKKNLDLFAPILALGYALGRLACFFQGCCYGKPTDSFLGFHFNYLVQAGQTMARHPTQLYAAVGELVLFFILIFIEKKKKSSLPEGELFLYWLIGHGVNRMVMEFFRDDPRGPLWLGMGISFWMACVLLIIGLGLKFRAKLIKFSSSLHSLNPSDK